MSGSEIEGRRESVPDVTCVWTLGWAPGPGVENDNEMRDFGGLIFADEKSGMNLGLDAGVWGGTEKAKMGASSDTD